MAIILCHLLETQKLFNEDWIPSLNVKSFLLQINKTKKKKEKRKRKEV